MAASGSSELSKDDARVEAGKLAEDSGVRESGHLVAGNQGIAGGQEEYAALRGKIKRPRNRVRRATIATVLALLGAGYLQWNATKTDHQFSNMGTVVLCFVLGSYILFQFHCLARVRWNGLVVPLAMGLAIVVAVTLFRFEGFSGELLPQYAYRFGSPPPAMRTASLGRSSDCGYALVWISRQ